jgi:PilZ domain
MTIKSADNEKRRFHRISFISNVKVSLDEQSWECSLLDISLKGVLIEPPEKFDVQSDALYSICLTLNENVAINMQAKIIHSEPNHLGFQWINIDLDSLTTLRRLLELNLNDSDGINRELAELISSRSSA